MNLFPQSPESNKLAGILVLILIFALAPLFAYFAGESSPVGEFLGASATLAPFVILAIAAYLSMQKQLDILKYPAYAILLGIIITTAFIAFFFGLISVLPPDIIFAEEFDPEAFDAAADAGILANIALLFLACAGAGILSFIPLIKTVRVYLASRLDFDPFCRVHIIALITIFAIILIPLVPVTITGVPPYLSESFMEILHSDASFLEGTVAIDIYTLFWTIFASFAIAGLFTKRNFRETIQRLGLAKPGLKEVLFAVVSALVLIAVFYAVDAIIAFIWNLFGWPVTDSEAFSEFLVPYMTLPGIVIASVCAGFGEEIAVRGVLQPRFGIILPAMLFASLHAFQYNWDGIISVFIAGLIFGLIRYRYSTTVSAITHTAYDFTLFLGLLLGLNVI